MIENEGSLVNRVMNGQVAGRRPRGSLVKDGGMNFEDCAASIRCYLLCMHITINCNLVNCRMHSVGTTPMFGDMFMKLD